MADAGARRRRLVLTDAVLADVRPGAGLQLARRHLQVERREARRAAFINIVEVDEQGGRATRLRLVDAVVMDPPGGAQFKSTQAKSSRAK